MWDICRAGISANIGGVAQITFFDASISSEVSYPVERMTRIRGSDRGFPTSHKAYWTIEEEEGVGIPDNLPHFVILLRHPDGVQFQAKFSVRATTGFSLNPMRLPVFAPTKVVAFHQSVSKGEALDHDFSTLDLQALIKATDAE